jgi:hypothetical protein
MAVCEFCRTTVLKDAASVRDLGKMAEVLEDFSPIQIGTAGQYKGRGFTVVGRIQLRYENGFWNEWHVLHDDGSSGWLSDASGQYALTAERPLQDAVPRFEELAPWRAVKIAGRGWVAADVRTARCTGGQGELPFQVGPGYEAKVADFRQGRDFLTLDYSDGAVPKLYAGESVTLEGLKCQLLRAPETIVDTAGRFRGKVAPLDCPACGGPVKYAPGMTVHMACPHCAAAVDLSGGKAEVLEAGARLAAVKTTLALGDEASINGAKYTLLGLMQRVETDDSSSRWTEYLLYAPAKPFIWLVETDEGWQRADVLDEWPAAMAPATAATLQGRTWKPLYEYGARVAFAAGSFNWRVKAGDTQRIAEYQSGQEKLAAESDATELGWSRSVPVPVATVMGWFGKQASPASVVAAPPGGYRATAKRFTIALLAINFFPFLFASGAVMGYMILALAGIWIPALVMDAMAAAKGSPAGSSSAGTGDHDDGPDSDDSGSDD